MTLSFLEIDRRWPGASVMWDREFGTKDIEPNFTVQGETLWHVCCNDPSIPTCVCVAWSGKRWVPWREMLEIWVPA